jgi:glycosyltransferase involved in cell wall biosynthesis
MIKKTLKQLYAEHEGKVSDKWSSYLAEYERIFDEYRDKPVRLLEIGVQNGGSLEIWSKYFSNAEKIVGCDINPDCGRLNYEDLRIALVVGDITFNGVQKTILTHAPVFDVIIDDGSHRSGDIVKTFAWGFSRLADGGVFIVEDLHCSYWKDFEGGLFDPFSSITFFQYLTDIINYEHWGSEKARREVLGVFFEKYGFWMEEESLQHIHSIEFINSMCIIRKAHPENNKLGIRRVTGLREMIEPGALALNGLEAAPISMVFPNPADRAWGNRKISPDEEFLLHINSLSERDKKISDLNFILVSHEKQIRNLQRVLAERESENTGLKQNIVGRDQKIDELTRTLSAYQNSISWLVTKPLRFIWHQICPVVDSIKKYFSNLNAFKKKVIQISQNYKHNGFIGSENDFNSLRRDLCFNVEEPPVKFINITKDFCSFSGWAFNLRTRLPVRLRMFVGKKGHYLYSKSREDVRQALKPEYDLPLETGFTATVMFSAGFYKIRIEAEINGLWTPIRHCFFLCLSGKNIQRKMSYTDWERLEKRRLKEVLPEIKRHIDVMTYKPMFTVIIDPGTDAADLEDTIQSIRDQLYTACDICILAGADGVSFSLPDDIKFLKDISVSDVSGDFIVFMQSGQRLAVDALYEFANALNQYPEMDLVYADEDSCNVRGSRYDPFHKPDWSPDYLETFNYIGFPACFRTEIARGCFVKAHMYDFVLRFTEATSKVMHLAKVLGHTLEKKKNVGVLAHTAALDIEALSGRLIRTGRRGAVHEHPLYKGCYEFKLDLKHSPLVSVIIPTAGKTVHAAGRQIDLIENVIGEIRNISTYKNIEIIVVDNGDLSPSQIKAIEEAECKRTTCFDPVFNFSRKLNLGVAMAHGEFLLLLNDDIEILTPSWIEKMLEHFEKPHVGVVGVKLLYPDEKTQHVGMVHNYGNPDHVRRFFPRNEAGYFFSTCGVRNYSAVTGACMMTPSKIYQKVGGYSEELAVNYNDVDYCMKVRKRGFWVVYAASIELTHLESQSRDASVNLEEIAWYHRQWAAEIVQDPFYNQRFLTVASPTFVPCINDRMI